MWSLTVDDPLAFRVGTPGPVVPITVNIRLADIGRVLVNVGDGQNRQQCNDIHRTATFLRLPSTDISHRHCKIITGH